MKKLLLLPFMIFPVFAFTQDCSGKIRAAQTSKAAGNYRKALAQFTAAASSCGENRRAEIEKEILDIYDRIERLKNEAESAKKVAATEAENAKISSKVAEESNRRAQVALDSLNFVLDNLGKANAECEVRLLLAEVERNQRELNFEAAVDKAKAAKTVGALPASVNMAYRNLSHTLLSHAWEDLRQAAYQSASTKIRGAEELNVLPDSVAIAYKRLSRALLSHTHRDLRKKDYQSALAKFKSAQELNVELDSLSAVNRTLQQFLFRNARLDILNTDYDSALEKTNALRSLQVPMDTIESLWFEIAFCNTESGNVKPAAAVLDTLAEMNQNDIVRKLLLALTGKEHAQQIQLLRQARKALDPQRNNSLTARYIPPVSVRIPEGTFVLGSQPAGVCQVTVNPFLLAAKELTFFEYDIFCAATNRPKPSDNGWGRGQRPVINIDWYDAVEYCNWRSRQEGLQEVYAINKEPDVKVICNWSANGYRLPTEAEWEFAAGNGEKHTRFSWGNELPTPQKGGNVADETAKTKLPNNSEIFTGYSDGFAHTAPTGLYPPNDFGLYDMTGNVWEWCWDWHDENYCRANKSRNPPQGPATGTERVLRGGSWGSFPKDCFVSHRFQSQPGTRNVSFGFRLARN